MCFQMRDALRVGCLYLSEEFFSVLMEEREALKAVRDELCRFAIVTVRRPHQPFSLPNVDFYYPSFDVPAQEPAKTLFGKIRKT
jgi:hypothetical protein